MMVDNNAGNPDFNGGTTMPATNEFGEPIVEEKKELIPEEIL